jgi:hypothetical protein
MKNPPAKITRKKPLILTERDEKILRAIYAYRYMTTLDVAWLLFRPTSKNHVGEVLTRLAGGKDLQTHMYLCRFGLPSVGNSERIFTLGARGRSFLSGQGLPVTWYFRPYKLKGCLKSLSSLVQIGYPRGHEPSTIVRDGRDGYRMGVGQALCPGG